MNVLNINMSKSFIKFCIFFMFMYFFIKILSLGMFYKMYFIWNIILKTYFQFNDNFVNDSADMLWLNFSEMSFISFIMVLFMICVMNPKIYESFLFAKLSIYLALFFFLCQIFFFVNCLGPSVLYFNDLLESNNFIISVKILLLFLSFSCLVISVDFFKQERLTRFEYPLFIMLAMYGMFMVMASSDFFLMAIGFELQTLCFFVMSSLYRYSNLGVEAAMKYYILGSFSSAMMFFGISIIFIFSGSCNFSVLEMLLNSKHLYLSFSMSELSIFIDFAKKDIFFGIFLGLCFFFVGVLFKFGIVPFHFWMPDVYAASPTVVSNFFAVVPKLVLLLVLMRVFSFDIDLMMFGFSDMFSFLGILSLIYGSIVGLYTIQMSRLIAYAAIAQAGFTILVFSLNSYDCIEACVSFFFIYFLILTNMFVMLSIYKKLPVSSELKNISEFSSFIYTNEFLAVNMLFSVLSLAGTPPLSGFFTKMLMFESLIMEGYYFLALLCLMLTMMTMIFYVRFMVVIWYSEKDYICVKSEFSVHKMAWIDMFLLLMTFFSNFLIFLNPQIFYDIVSMLVRSFLDCY